MRLIFLSISFKDFFILVITNARIAYEGNVKVAPFTANDKRKISWKFLKIRKMSGQKQSKQFLWMEIT